MCFETMALLEIFDADAYICYGQRRKWQIPKIKMIKHTKWFFCSPLYGSRLHKFNRNLI